MTKDEWRRSVRSSGGDGPKTYGKPGRVIEDNGLAVRLQFADGTKSGQITKGRTEIVQAPEVVASDG